MAQPTILPPFPIDGSSEGLLINSRIRQLADCQLAD